MLTEARPQGAQDGDSRSGDFYYVNRDAHLNNGKDMKVL